MAEVYNLGITDVLDRESQNVRGFLVTIEPPVDLDPDTVNAAITRDTLNSGTPSSTDTSLERATLIGSSNTRTAIYVSLPPDEDGYEGFEPHMMGDHRNDIERGITGLLRMLGIDDEMIEVQESPETTEHYMLKY